jgi:5-methylcytosine-specific restriction endonuclease McrA
MPNRPPQHRPAHWQPAPRKRPEARVAFYGTREWRKLSAAVIARDGGICSVCGKPGANTAHHITERRNGGADEPRNLLSVHAACHARYHPQKGWRR